MPRPEPERPEQAGVPERAPELMQVEAARLLVNDAMPALAESGFERQQVVAWARTYIAEEGSGDAESFIRWIANQEAGGAAADKPSSEAGRAP